MKNIAILLVFIAATFAGCGGSGVQGNKFNDEAKFEQQVLTIIQRQHPNIGARKLVCTKTSATTADCILNGSISLTVECSYVDSSGGHDCIYKQS